MRLRSTSWALLAIGTLVAASAWAQAAGDTASDQTSSPAPAQNQNAPAAATAAKYKLNFGGIDFSGMVDGYYSLNFNHPDAGFNQLYNFDDKTNRVDLNLLKLTASHDPDPIGFRVDIGLGRVFSNINPAPNPDPDFFRYVGQAYVSVKPRGWSGFEPDFGDFVTSADAGVIETKDK